MRSLYKLRPIDKGPANQRVMEMYRRMRGEPSLRVSSLGTLSVDAAGRLAWSIL